MHNIRKINDDLIYIGCSERRLSLFESVYPVPDGVSYNSYFLDDEKTVLIDTVEKCCEIQFFENLEYALNGRNLDYLIINHLEPDHSALIKTVIEKYNNVKIVCNQKIKQMLYQFFDFKFDIEQNFHVVKEGDILSTGRHEFTFVMAPMVHWPEVMVTYDITDKILFSADAFGSFGAINGNLFDDEVDFEQKIPEYRRYYTNIVGKYAPQTTLLLNKAKTLDIEMVCPLHGLILKRHIDDVVELYTHWASYSPEEQAVLIAYSSVYGNTKNAVEILAAKLAEQGVKNIKMFDVSFTHHSYILAEAFRCSHIVIGTTTYNNCVFVNMSHFIEDILRHNLKHRTYAIIENGSWIPNCMGTIEADLSKLRPSSILENKIALKSSVKDRNVDELDVLAKDIAQDILKLVL